jgi:hypothetical protein
MASRFASFTSSHQSADLRKQRENTICLLGQDDVRPVRLAYQPPASSTFLSEQTSNQPTVLFSQNKPALAISHQPNEQARARPNVRDASGDRSRTRPRHRSNTLLLVISVTARGVKTAGHMFKMTE